MGGAQRVAIVWNHPSRLRHCSFRFEQYVRGFSELGHDPVIVCTAASGEGFAAPLLTVPDSATLDEESFWRGAKADVVVAVTWHRMSAMLGAARRAGAKTVSIADSDGRVGLGSHPLATLERSMAYAGSRAQRIRCLVQWLKRYATESWRGSPEDGEYLASTESSDAVILGNPQAKEELAHFLERAGRADLDRRVHVVPFTIAEPYLAREVPESRPDRVVAIGRWDDPQKDAGLLAEAVSGYLSDGGRTELLIFGAPSPTLGDLAARHPAVRLMGLAPPDTLSRALGESRAIAFSSRWEGSPHAGFEALAMGLTVVGTPIPFVRACAMEGFGTVASDRRPSSLARALRGEMAAWESGRRSAVAIAAEWRPRLDPARVCGEMLARVGL